MQTKKNCVPPPVRTPPPSKPISTAPTIAITIAIASLLIGAGCEDTQRLMREAEEGVGFAGETTWLTLGYRPLPQFLEHEGERPADIVGYVRKGSGAHWVSVALFDGSTFEQRWEAGPFKASVRYGRLQPPLFVVTKEHVVASPDRRSVRVFRGEDGHELANIEFDSEVRALCLAGDEGVHVDVASTRHQRLDVSTLQLHPVSNTICHVMNTEEELLTSLRRCGHNTSFATCVDSDVGLNDATPLETTSYLLQDERDHVIAVGRHNENALYDTTIIGRRPGQLNDYWWRTLDARVRYISFQPDALYAVVQSTSFGARSRLIALNPESGDTLWDIELPWSEEAVTGPLIFDNGRLYLPRPRWLDVFDAENGATLANIGATP